MGRRIKAFPKKVAKPSSPKRPRPSKKESPQEDADQAFADRFELHQRDGVMAWIAIFERIGQRVMDDKALRYRPTYRTPDGGRFDNYREYSTWMRRFWW